LIKQEELQRIQKKSRQSKIVKSQRDLYRELLSFMKSGETVAIALSRRNVSKKRFSGKNKKKGEDMSIIDEDFQRNKEEIDKITDLCQFLLDLNDYGIYEETFETLALKSR
jgi:hypothetical protein